jgi:hypothetical protein
VQRAWVLDAAVISAAENGQKKASGLQSQEAKFFQRMLTSLAA